MLCESAEFCPSLPRQTLTPAETRLPTGAIPFWSFRFEIGLCETDAPCSARRRTSAASICTACETSVRFESNPNFASRAIPLMPHCSNDTRRWSADSSACTVTGTPVSRTSRAADASKSSLAQTGLPIPSPSRTVEGSHPSTSARTASTSSAGLCFGICAWSTVRISAGSAASRTAPENLG